MVKHCKFVLDGLLVFDILWCAHCSGVQIFDIFIEAYLPPASEVWEGYVITRVCHSVHGGGDVCVGWYPSMLCRSPGPHPWGRLRGILS